MVDTKKTENVSTNGNVVPANIAALAVGGKLPDFDKWEEETVGFAPYWNPEEGKWFYARIVERDDRDPEFVRYLFQAGMPTPCARGAEDSETFEPVMINTGEYFTISVYFSLQGLFDLYLETGHRPYIKVISVKKVPTKKTGRNVWLWKVLSDPKDKRIMNQKRLELKAAQNDAQEPKLTSGAPF